MQELIEIPQENALAIFSSTDDGLRPYIERIRQEVSSLVPDVSTKKGRAEIASMAHKVARSKTHLDGIGKELVASLKQLPAKVDATRKAMREELDALRDEVRRPLDEWEAAESARVEAHQNQVNRINALAVFTEDNTAADIAERLEIVKQFN